MISEIIAKNFIMFKNMDLKFKEGLNVITGETGAGKSLIVKLIDILTGNKATTDSIRFGEEECVLQGVFGKNEETIITRLISAKNKNNIKLNGLRISLKELQESIQNQIYVHSQNKQYQLLNPKYIYRILSLYDDRVNSLEIEYSKLYNQCKTMERQLEDFAIDPKELNRKIDILKYQINEIESANLSQDEEEKVKQEYKILNNFERIDSILNDAKIYINDTDGILDKLNKLSKDFDDVKYVDKKFEYFSSRLNNIAVDLQDLLEDIDKYSSNMEYDKDKISFYEERLNTIYTLKNKYGSTIEDILNYLKNIKEEYSKLNSLEKEKESLQRKLSNILGMAKNKAIELSKARKKSAKELAKKVSEILPDLGMGGAEIKFNFSPLNSLSSTGLDSIKLEIRTNIGEPYRNYNTVLSGGELSRLMLAFELNIRNSILADTLVFDEIDTGIGGETAIKLGKKLKELTNRGYQIILVTHLPQIAIFADNHIKVEKFVKNGRTYSETKMLNDKEKEREIERMRSVEEQ